MRELLTWRAAALPGVIVVPQFLAMLGGSVGAAIGTAVGTYIVLLTIVLAAKGFAAGVRGDDEPEQPA